jgi:predicted nucleic acid-binding protein
MKTVVLDTSALLRLFIPDGPVSQDAETALRLVEHGKLALLAPELMLAEAAQVLHKKTLAEIISSKERDDLLEEIVNLPIQYLSHKPLLKRSVAVAETYGLSVYDAIFLALAEKYNSVLVTMDDDLAKAAAKVAIEVTLTD